MSTTIACDACGQQLGGDAGYWAVTWEGWRTISMDTSVRHLCHGCMRTAFPGSIQLVADTTVPSPPPPHDNPSIGEYFGQQP
jgi:hypothetical protein